jgi:hypothetical protein
MYNFSFVKYLHKMNFLKIMNMKLKGKVIKPIFNVDVLVTQSNLNNRFFLRLRQLYTKNGQWKIHANENLFQNESVRRRKLFFFLCFHNMYIMFKEK